MPQLTSTPEENVSDEHLRLRVRNALFVLAGYLVGGLIAGVYLTFQVIGTPSWQLWLAVIAFFLIVISAAISLLLVRRGYLEIGVWSMVIVSYISALVLAITISGLGLALLSSAIFLSGMVAIQTLRSRQATMLLTGIFAGLIYFLVDSFIPTARINIPGLQNLVNFLVPVLLILFGVAIFRQFRNYSLRTKLILTVTLVVVIAVSVVAFLNDRSNRAALTTAAYDRLLSAASQTATRVDDVITNNLAFIRTEAETPSFAEYLNLRASGQTTSEAEASIAVILKSFAERDPQSITSYALLDRNGVDVADTYTADIGKDKSDREYFQNPMKTGQVYVSPAILSATRAGDIDLYFSGPVRNAAGQVIGVLRFSYSIKGLQALVAQSNGLAGAQSYAVLLDEYHIRLAHGTTPNLVLKSVVPLDPVLLANLQAAGRLQSGTAQELSTNLSDTEAALQNMEKQPVFTSAAAALGGSAAATAVVKLKTQPWILYYRMPESVFLVPIEAQTRTTILVAFVVILLAIGSAAGLAQVLVAPIIHLTTIARKVAEGDLDVQVRVETEDETGVLAKTFNDMTEQLRSLIGTLESRVAERTAKMERRNLDLALATEIGQTVSQVGDINVMLRDAAEIIRTFFGLYYVQVYLVDPKQTELILQVGTGEVGEELLKRRHRLPLNMDSLNGRAAMTGRPVVIADTAASDTFRPNPLLPATRSEIAVPLLVGDTLIGVLDAQSEQAGLLNEEALLAFEPMAGQMAIAIQNSRLVAETERARAEGEMLLRRLTREGWGEYLDALHQPEQTGFVFENDQVTLLTEQVELTSSTDKLAAPISVSGERLGALVVEMEEQKRSPQSEQLIFAVARQVSQQIENLRLLDSAERYRLEAEEAARRLTAESWGDFLAGKTEKARRYFYDLREVKPREEALDMQNLTLPLKIRDTRVGKVAIVGINPADSKAVQLANAVAERLSSHLETLRLSEQTQERARREQALRQITSAVRGSTNPETILRTAVRELGGLLGRKTVVRLATAKPESVPVSGSEPPAPAESVSEDGGKE